MLKQVSAFGQFQEINISSPQMRKLYDDLLQDGMMPTVAKEIDSFSQRINNRPCFVSQSGAITIMVGSNRLDIVSGEQSTSIEDFFATAQKYFEKFFAVFEGIGIFRLSFICDILLKEFEDNESDCADKYINLDYVYNKEKVNAWSANSVSIETWNIGKHSEPVNLNTTISLAKQRSNFFQEEKINIRRGIMLHQDLNTTADNMIPRFHTDDIFSFIELVSQKHLDICKSMERGLQ